MLICKTCFIASSKESVRKADSTLRSSQAVPCPSTDRALRCLTSDVKRDPVHSTRYGRRQNVWLGICRHQGSAITFVCKIVIAYMAAGQKASLFCNSKDGIDVCRSFCDCNAKMPSTFLSPLVVVKSDLHISQWDTWQR